MSVFKKRFPLNDEGANPIYALSERQIICCWTAEGELSAFPRTVEQIEWLVFNGFELETNTRMYEVEVPCRVRVYRIQAESAKQAGWLASAHGNSFNYGYETPENFEPRAREVGIELGKPYNPPMIMATGEYLDLAVALGIEPLVNADTGWLRVPREDVRRVVGLIPGYDRLMCREYGDDDDWSGITSEIVDDWFEEDGEIPEEYQTFEIW